jgi:hypothetical protein
LSTASDTARPMPVPAPVTTATVVFELILSPDVEGLIFCERVPRS